MRIASDALARLAGSKFTAETVAHVMEFMRQKADLTGAVSSALTFDFQKESDVVTQQDMIPVLTLTLRPATINVATAPEMLRDTRLPRQPAAGDAPQPGHGPGFVPGGNTEGSPAG